MPEVVISLDAGDGFLKHRVMNLPQRQVEGTHNTEDGRTCIDLQCSIHFIVCMMFMCRLEEEAGVI